MKTVIIAAFLALAAAPAIAEGPVATTLEAYSFDFATIGYEIEVQGTVRNLSEPLEGSDYTWLTSKGYKMKVRISPLARRAKQSLTAAFNENCVGFGSEYQCPARISGEVQLNEDMQVELYARAFELMGTVYR